VGHIDQCIALLTGCEAGTELEDGGFAADTVNARVRKRLLAYADQRHAFTSGGKDDHAS
jgi:hypothetical protein